MQEPFEPTPEEIVPTPEPAAEEALAADAPMREVAHAFRMNAEALHTLKEMQADLARQVRRGDRSELVVQSTQALNETFRNLTSVQQELLRRMHVSEQKRGSGPLIPMMLLGLLVVLLGGLWVVIDLIQEQKAADPELSAAEVVRRERDAWKQGRAEGAQHADNEVKRLGEAVEDAKSRAGILQREIDDRQARIADIDQARRAAEIERDEFASQVRKAQSEMMAKKVLEEEIVALKLERDRAQRSAEKAEHDRELTRRKNAHLREMMADHRMGFDPDDPPWRPGLPAGATPEGMDRVVPLEDDGPYAKLSNIERAMRERDRVNGREPGATSGSASDTGANPATAGIDRDASAVPPPAGTKPGSKGKRGAAYGGDRPGMPPPAILRDRRSVDANTNSVERVRHHLNGLLKGADSVGGAGWRITSLREVGADRLGGVTMVRYDTGGRTVESVEAREVSISYSRGRKQVEFAFRQGARQISGQRLALPSVGSRVVVAEGQRAQPWDASPLRVIQKR